MEPFWYYHIEMASIFNMIVGVKIFYHTPITRLGYTVKMKWPAYRQQQQFIVAMYLTCSIWDLKDGFASYTQIHISLKLNIYHNTFQKKKEKKYF